MAAETEIIEKQEQRFFIDLDARTLRSLALVVFSGFWIYTALLTLPFGYWIPQNNLDGSHIFGSNYFPQLGFKYGSDLIFTFGPLGYLVYPENIGNHIVIANLIRGAIWLLLLVHLILFYRLGATGCWKSLLLMLAIIAARSLFIQSFDYYAVSVLFVLVLFLIERPTRSQTWLASASIIFIACVVALMKFTGFVYTLAGLVLLFAVHTKSLRNRLQRRDLYLSFAAIVTPILAFVLHARSLTAFFRYVYGSLQLSSGYNEAMSLPAVAADLFYGVSLTMLFVFGVIYGGMRKALSWKVALVLLFLFWLSLKHGFVRADDHPPWMFSFVIVIAAILICLLRPSSRLILPYIVAYPFFVMVALSGMDRHWHTVWTEAFWSSASTRQTAADLIDWKTTADRIDIEKNKIDEFQRLPDIFRARLENSSAIIFPWELAYARSGHFKLQPLYTMQAYTAYTAYLDRQTAEHLRLDRTGAEYVLFDWDAIDERHPLLDVPSTWIALTDNFEPAELSAGKLLLKRRNKPLTHTRRILQDVALPIGKWVNLPEGNADLWATIRIRYSAFAQLRKTLYKANAVYLTVDSNGLSGRFRVIPGVLTSPFPLRAFPIYFESFVAMIQSNRVDSPITRIRLDTDSPGDFREPSMELFEEMHSRLTFSNVSEKSLQTEFHIASPSAITNVIPTFGIDVINSIHSVQWPDDQHPFVTDNGLFLEGWLADSGDGRAFDVVYAVVNGTRLLKATAQPRPDVSANYKNPALDRCGFRIQIESSLKGVQKVDLIGLREKDQALYRLPKSLYVEFR